MLKFIITEVWGIHKHRKFKFCVPLALYFLPSSIVHQVWALKHGLRSSRELFSLYVQISECLAKLVCIKDDCR